MAGLAAQTRCQALVAGFGRPGMRDLDFGRQVVRYLEAVSWPEGVVVEDLSYAAPLVLHRLQELEPAQLVLVGAVARGVDAPGTVRRYRLDIRPPAPEEVQRSLEESVQGVIDLDHTLAVARHWGGLPAETVVIEVEAADCSFGVGFSDELAATLDQILAMVREEISCSSEVEEPVISPAVPVAVGARSLPVPLVEPSPGLSDLAQFAHEHRQQRLVQAHRAKPDIDRVAGGRGAVVAGRSQPWGVGIDNGGDWYDVIPLDGGWLGIVIGDAPGRGVEAAPVMTDLRAAVRAYAVLDGADPGRVLEHLDRFVHATGVGKATSLAYAAVRPSTGDVRLVNAGGCPPLLLGGAGGGGQYVHEGRSGSVGCDVGGRRPVASLSVTPGSTLLLFTDGIVQSRTRQRGTGMEVLRRAAVEAPGHPEMCCDAVVEACKAGLRRDDDICVVAVGL